MKCLSFRGRIHDFLDGALTVRDMARMSSHTVVCRECRRFHSEHLLIRSALAERTHLPEASADLILRRIQRKRGVGLESLRDWADRIRTYWRDLDRRIIWARVTAMPFTVCLFALLLIHFVPSNFEKLAFLVVSANPGLGAERSTPQISNVQARQNRQDLNGLMDTAWRLPYEDSLSLVAEIRPGGHAEIDSILEYPKSRDLLNAVHLSLQRSRFERAAEISNSLLIFSFQKIDVYERAVGL